MTGTDDAHPAQPNPWRAHGSDPCDPAAWRAPVPTPYRGTPFEVVDVPPTPLGRAEFVARVRRRLRRARSGRARVEGRPVGEADVRTAEDALARPGGWAAARLLTPTPHPEPVDAPDLRERLARLDGPPPATGAGRVDRAVLAELLGPRPEAAG